MNLRFELETLGLEVRPSRAVLGWFCVINRQQIAMYQEVREHFHGWCITPNGRIDVTSPQELLGAIKAVI